LIKQKNPLPGVLDMLEAGKSAGLKIGLLDKFTGGLGELFPAYVENRRIF